MKLSPKLTRTVGGSGLLQLGGVVVEECNKELRYPRLIKTLEKMSKDAAIAPALDLVESMISGVEWEVRIPEGYESKLEDKAIFIKQCLEDMEMPWDTVMRQIATMNTYGFSVMELTLRHRLHKDGSRYNDGLVGVRGLYPRAQSSITRWKFDKNGNKVLGVYQNVNPLNEYEQGMDFLNTTVEAPEERFIPREKFLHFVVNPEKGSPVGKSPLVGAHKAWKYKVAFEEMEAKGVVQEVNSLKVLYIPAKYMSKDATEEDKEAYNMFQKALNSMHYGESSGMILPLLTDERGNKLFELDVKSTTGTSNFDINEIIKRYTLECLTALFADILSLGQSGGGSFSLAESKMSVIETVVRARLNEIKSQFNHQLIRQIFIYNGWDTSVMPYLDYGEVDKINLDEYSKFIQRIKATGMMPRHKDVINKILRVGGFSYQIPEDATEEEMDKLLGTPTTRSGDGLAKAGSGTSDKVSEEDSSISNLEN